MKVSLGVGITNDCDLDCAHCYRPQDRIYQLSLDDVRAICERLGFSEYAGHQYDDDRREEIIAVFRSTFRTKTMAQWEKALADLANSCPIVGSYGQLDKGLEKEPKQIADALEANSIPYDIKVYAGAGHSFMNDHVDSEVPKWAVIMGKLSASEYHEPSAMDARSRIVAFFDTHLRS